MIKHVYSSAPNTYHMIHMRNPPIAFAVWAHLEVLITQFLAPSFQLRQIVLLKLGPETSAAQEHRVSWEVSHGPDNVELTDP